MDELIERIKQWGIDRGLDGSNADAQMNKLLEEVQELDDAIEDDLRDDMQDAIGDITVVLVMMCLTAGFEFRDCVQAAYDEIKDRKGKLVNGVFIKDE